MIKKYNDIIILVIIWIISIYSLIMVILKSYDIGLPNYLGYGLLATISVLRFYKVKKFKTILGVFLILGSLNVFQFTSFTMTMAFNWAPFGNSYSTFGIQPISFILMIFLIAFNFSSIIDLFDDLFAEDPKIKLEQQKRIATMNYEKLKDEKNERLQEIVANKNMYQIDYFKAAERLIDERKLKENSLQQRV
jgi:hypothetical protein